MRSAFPTFPEFHKLSFTDRHSYQAAVATFPPVSDIAFSTLMIWWNFEPGVSVSTLKGNLILDYKSRDNGGTASGLSIIGVQDVDDSIMAVFRYLSEKGRSPLQLVHVPEFVIERISNPALFDLVEERDYDEYIYSAASLSDMQGPEYSRLRTRVSKFNRRADGIVSLGSVDLQIMDVQAWLLDAYDNWSASNKRNNDPMNEEKTAITTSITHASKLGIKNLCLYIDDVLTAYALYELSSDGQYITAHHLKVDPSVEFCFDYMIHELARSAHNAGALYVNLEMDLGIEGLRTYKTRLKPIGFFKKYTVIPKYSV